MMRRYAFWIFLLLLVAALIAAPTNNETARTRIADGFDQPVGRPNAEGYYMSRGFRANRHMGEDWNGLAGGDSDLGAPVYCVAHGYVVLARDMRMSWGNLVIVRHTYAEDGQLKTVDSLYAHLNKITVREGQQIVRGQQLGTIGNNRGMYRAHLHFEIRKNLAIGYNQSAFAKSLANYYSPTSFIAQRRKLSGGGRSAMIAINTFTVPIGTTPDNSKLSAKADKKSSQPTGQAAPPPPKSRGGFKVNRYDDAGSF